MGCCPLEQQEFPPVQSIDNNTRLTLGCKVSYLKFIPNLPFHLLLGQEFRVLPQLLPLDLQVALQL